MRTADFIRTGLDWSLCLLLIPAGLLSLEVLTVAFLGFGLPWGQPGAIIVCLADLGFPVFLGWALHKSFAKESLKTTASLALVAWLFVGFITYKFWHGA